MQLQPGGQVTHIDIEQMRLKLNLSYGQRIVAMLAAHEMIVGMIRGRLKQERPDLTDFEVGLLVIEEIEHSKRHEFRP